MQPAEQGTADSSCDETHGRQHHENQTDAGSLAGAASTHLVRLDLASIVHHQHADRAELDLIACLVPALYLIHRSIRRRFVVEHRKHDLLVTHLLTSLILGRALRRHRHRAPECGLQSGGAAVTAREPEVLDAAGYHAHGPTPG